MGVFLCFSGAMSALAGITFTWRGTALDKIWALNPEAYRQMAPMGRSVGLLFLLLSAVWPWRQPAGFDGGFGDTGWR